MTDTVKRKLRNALPDHTRIYIMYGATEASARLTYLDPDKFDDKMGSIGKPIPGVKLKVVDSTGKEVPTGQIGELVASGDNIMAGYWKDTENNKVISSLGYHTRDLGYQDEEGFFYVTERKDNIIKVGGHKINPNEIEEAIMATEKVVETIVVGISDNLLGNKIVALLVPVDKDLKEDIIYRLISKQLPKNMMPSDIKFVRSLPKNASGKIDRTLCSGLAAA